MNNTLKSVEAVYAPPAPHMVGDGFRVHNFFPSPKIGKKRMSPFFLMDYNAKMEFSPTPNLRGVGAHPHRGFETVSIAYHGRIAHHDSHGNSGVIGEGDVQWMTAGSGLLHKEYHEQEFSRTGGLFQMVQLWVNLPAKDKMTDPKYQAITKSMMGRMTLDDGSNIEVLAGTYGDIQGPASTFTPMHIYNLRLKKAADLSFQLPTDFNTGLLVIEGKTSINGSTVNADHFILLNNDGDTVQVKVDEDAVVLVLSGQPIDEPIAQYGPFLMNTWQELEQAIEDVSRGKFGELE